MEIKQRLTAFLQTIPKQVQLVAVSKTKPDGLILEAYQCGQRAFGENKVQELAAKKPRLPDDIEWHFVGHLQRNKVKYIAGFVSLLHGIDSLKLLLEVDRQAARHQRIIPCLLQFHIAEEESKFGLNLTEAENLLQDESFKQLKHIQISGVMGMATNTANEQQISKEFRNLKRYYLILKEKYFPNDSAFREISMGMSGDYRLAIREGSTMIRIGTKIFGERNQ
ncbi:MAG: YggS family pyridoxal phosphate-dependent enzyme [Bacteroidales bacterium]|nr:YggS family pyridoxal phosphate-dependent enzyme [Bacteroidales bacterium]